MDDLVQFLRDRLDEDERIAKACAGNGQWDAEDIAIYGKDLAPEVRAHMANHDPARVLTDIEARRGIINEHTVTEPFDFEGKTGTVTYCPICRNDGECPTLRLLALPYADHPDYNQAWRP